MNSLAHGENTSPAEITHISAHGVWLLAHGKELFMSYADFPWFKEQTVQAILNVVEEAPRHYSWPDLDVDLSEDIIEHPERFPLTAKNV